MAIREGDYKNCFRKGEGKHFLGYGKDTGRKFSFSRFFHKNIEKKTNSPLFPYFFSKILKMFYVFAASGRGSRRKFPFYPNGRGGQKLPYRGGLYFGGTAYWNPPPLPPRLAHLWGGRRVTDYVRGHFFPPSVCALSTRCGGGREVGNGGEYEQTVIGRRRRRHRMTLNFPSKLWKVISHEHLIG